MVPRQQGPGSGFGIVTQGYDRLGSAYEEWSNTLTSSKREMHTEILLRGLSPGSQVLDLGCGPGQTLQKLAEKFTVTGVDISETQITLARDRVPSATLIVAEMTSASFPAGCFDGVAAFYSITHVPRSEHARLFRRIYRWLRPGGLFVASLGSRDEPGSIEQDWLGVPMYFSHWDAQTNRRLISGAGFELLRDVEEATEEDGQPVSFLWVVARRPAGSTLLRSSGGRMR
ncbi:MAG: class I SAM-dependent methyltransferase [bacterium]|nr:class I SAM-dependent methyltransferase [bacterium]